MTEVEADTEQRSTREDLGRALARLLAGWYREQHRPDDVEPGKDTRRRARSRADRRA